MTGFAASIFGKFYKLAQGRQRNKWALRTYKISFPKILAAKQHAAERFELLKNGLKRQNPHPLASQVPSPLSGRGLGRGRLLPLLSSLICNCRRRSLHSSLST